MLAADNLGKPEDYQALDEADSQPRMDPLLDSRTSRDCIPLVAILSLLPLVI